MKRKDLQPFTDDELRSTWWKLQRNEVDSLPENLREFVLTESTLKTPIGNMQTRILRLVNLISEEVNRRFIAGEVKTTINPKDETLRWFNKRIADTQAEYDAINMNDIQDEFGNIIDYSAYSEKLSKGGKLRGLKEGLQYLISHNYTTPVTVVKSTS
jgi:hypothetical protein